MAYSDRASNPGAGAGPGGWDPREGRGAGGGPGFFGANGGGGGGPPGGDGWGGRFGGAGGFMNDMMGAMGGGPPGAPGAMHPGMMNNMMGRGADSNEPGFGGGGGGGMPGMMNNMMGRAGEAGFGRGMGAGMGGFGGPGGGAFFGNGAFGSGRGSGGGGFMNDMMDRMSGGGMDRMPGGAMDRMSGGGMDRMPGGGMDRMPGSGMDRMSGGAVGGMAGMMGKAGEFFGGGNQGGMGRSGYGDRDSYGQRDRYGSSDGPSPYGPGGYGGRGKDWYDGGRDGRYSQGYGRSDRRSDRRDDDDDEEEEDRSFRGLIGRMFKRGDDDDDDDDDEASERDRRSGRYGGYQRGQPPYGGGGGYGPYGRGDEFNRPPYDGRGDDFPRTYSGGRPGGPMGRRSPYQSPYHGPMPGPGGLNEAMGALNLGGNPGGGGMQMQPISLEMSAKGLKKKDLVGKSDPVCYVYVPDQRTLSDGRQDSPANMKWKVLSRTEIVKNTHTPTWGTRVPITYVFSEMQLLRFSIYDADGEYETARDGDKIGECCVSLGEIVRRGVVTVQLVRNLRSNSASGRYGTLTVRAHSDSVEGKIRMKVNFSAKNLTKSDTFGKADPFYVFTSIGTSGEENRQIHKSEVCSNTLNPEWRPRRDLLSSHGKPWDRIKLRVSIYDHDTGGKSDLMGTVDFTLQQLTKYQKFDIINEKAAAEEGGRYQNSGELIVQQAEIMRMPPFLAYLQGGMQLEFLVCVDFSNSGERGSLHEERNSGRMSYYGQALSAVGSVLSGYLHDGTIAAYGFGAKPRHGGTGRHDPFPLNENPNDPRVYGVEGLLEAYHRALRNVRDGSKTKFEPLIRHAMRVTENRQVSQGQQHFTILMVLTDGQVDDMEETVDAVIECSYNHPIAIVFVGVGKGDFSDMRRLDGDKETLKSDRTHKRAKHDIVQFSQFKPNDGLEAFAASVLKEIPRRLVCYMMDLGVFPNAPLHGGGMGRGMPGEMSGMGRGMPGEMGGMGRGMPGEMGGMGRGMPGEMSGMGRGMPGEMGGMGRGMPGEMGGMGRGMPGEMSGMGRGMPGEMGGMGPGMPGEMGGLGRGGMGAMGRGGRGDMMGFGRGMSGRGQRSPHMNAMQGPPHMPPQMMLPPGMQGNDMMGFGRGQRPYNMAHGGGPPGFSMGMPPGMGMMQGRHDGGMPIPGMGQRGAEGRPGGPGGGGPSSF